MTFLWIKFRKIEPVVKKQMLLFFCMNVCLSCDRVFMGQSFRKPVLSDEEFVMTDRAVCVKTLDHLCLYNFCDCFV